MNVGRLDLDTGPLEDSHFLKGMCSFLGVITLRPADIADASTAMGETDSFFRSTTGHFRDTTSAFRDTHNGFRDTGGVCGNRSRLRVFPKMKPCFTGHGELVFQNPPEAI